MFRAGLAVLYLSLTGVCVVGGGAKQADSPVSMDDLAKALRPLLVEAVPEVLYEDDREWGRQRPTPHALHWRGLRPRIVKEMRNDGRWRRIKVTAPNLERVLDLRLGHLYRIDDDRQGFKCFIAFNTRVEFEQQRWESGVRLYGANVRARMRVQALMDCENLIRTEVKEGALLPDVVFRLQVTKAKVSYDDLVFEHIAGLGGDGARVLGEAVHDALNQWRPSIERNLLQKANKAIVKAADTKEVRLGLSSLFKSK